MVRRRFVLIDPSLRGAGGHYLSYADQVLRAAQAHGLEPRLIGHRDCSGALTTPLGRRWPPEPAYRRDYWGRASVADAASGGARVRFELALAARAPRSVRALVRALRRVQHARVFAEDTWRLLQRLELGPPDLVFLPNVSPAELLGLAWCLTRRRDQPGPSWHLLLRRDVDTPPGEPPVAGAIARGLARLAGIPRVVCYSDTDHLAARYAAVGQVEVATLPIPVAPELRPVPRAHDPQRLVLGYLGDARFEKGFLELADLIERAIREPWGGPRLQLIAQCYGTAADPALARARARLAALPSPQVELIDAALDTAAYIAVLRRLDVLLLPYQPHEYTARSSGIFAEGLCAGVPPLVPAGTWMADQLQSAICQQHQRAREQAELLSRHSLGPGDPVGLPIPQRSTHVLVRFDWPARTAPHARADVALEVVATPGHPARAQRAIVGRSTGLRSSSLLVTLGDGNVPAGARLRVRPGSAGEATLPTLDVEFLRLPPSVPTGAVGAIYCGREQQLSALQELVTHYAHYRATALEFSRTWAEHHQPTRLVASLLERAA